MLATGIGAHAETPRAGPAIPISLRDAFPIGSNGLCEAQIVAPEPGAGLFDRRYSVICRDAAAPVGTLWVVKGGIASEAQGRFAEAGASCNPQTGSAAAPARLGRFTRLDCTAPGSVLRTNVLAGEVGGRTYAASGLAAYGKALELGLASLVEGRVMPGTVEIPLTQLTDDLAFTRQQAEAIAADLALAEGYRRSNAGRFAEAAEFFAASSEAAVRSDTSTEAMLNAALQQSNLGNFVEARRLLAKTRAASVKSPILARLQRNYEALDALNQRQPQRAIAILEAPLANDFPDERALRELQIGPALAGRLSADNARLLSAGYTNSLTPLERAELLDGQADYLKASALRQVGRESDAAPFLERANTTFAEVRGGKVVSIIWLRAQVLAELAELAERAGRLSEAEALHGRAIALVAASYPGSPALDSARAQLAGLYARTGRRDEALGLYRAIVSDAKGRPLTSLRRLMMPYFSLLSGDGSGLVEEGRAVSDLFAASQLLQRSGLAQTQAVLARELSGGSDAAAELFRGVTNLARAIEQTRTAVLQMEGLSQLSPDQQVLLEERRNSLVQLQEQQAGLLQKLAENPRYRVVAGGALELADLQASLGEGEAYLKMIVLDPDAYMVFVAPREALAWRIDAKADDLERLVTTIRESIAVVEAGQVLTYPFDVAASRELYLRLFGPIAARLPEVRHIVFEPDGALLKLPINLLITDDASVARYQQRTARSDGDEYDFRDIAWLGRSSEISTSVGSAAFRDVRRAPRSGAAKTYLGLGENAPVGTAEIAASRTRAALEGGENCLWSPNIWSRPIKADELFAAARRFGSGTRVITRSEFSDSAIRRMDDLADYRILHFATHGLVTAPQPQCPPRPALLTSFGDDDSDGLLTFGEIFNLRIDADLVILSACDTAGSATVGATREAGITSGGDFALDGLVRAFVGAGGRTVLASHWPVPDDFSATQRLISGLFSEDAASTAAALRRSQLSLMDAAETSHPFYWSAFAVVGDGAAALVR
ncbi:MAG: CHAT domain-containing protein [Erythrobacter sp.]